MQTELQSVSDSTDEQLLGAEHWGAEGVRVGTKLKSSGGCANVSARCTPVEAM